MTDDRPDRSDEAPPAPSDRSGAAPGDAPDAIDLDALRAEIDRLDESLLRTLSERLGISERVGRYKSRETSRAIFDPERERQLFTVWVERAQQMGVSTYFAGRILREVLDFSRRSQEPILTEDENGTRTVTVGYQGLPHAYSEMAAQKLFDARNGGRAVRKGYPTFESAVRALREERVDYVLLPVENSAAGPIPGVDRLLMARDLFVVDEETWEVEHILAAPPGATIESLKEIRSHPAALSQCEAFLQGLPGVRVEPWFDTAGAARDVARAEDITVGAISSRQAAFAHGLDVLASDIGDEAPNVTRFLLVGRQIELPDPRIPAKTSLHVILDHKQGALALFLGDLAQGGINLTRIESRPQPRTPGRYQFFVDVEGRVDVDPLASALEAAREHCHELRILGSYPSRPTNAV